MKKKYIYLVILFLVLNGVNNISGFLTVNNIDSNGIIAEDNDSLQISGLSDPYHVTSVIQHGTTGETLGDQLKYDDGDHYTVKRSTVSLLDYFDSFSKSSDGWEGSTSGNPASAMLTKNDANTYYHYSYGKWLQSDLRSYQYFTLNLGSAWKDDYYLTGWKIEYDVHWSIGNDFTSYAWSKIQVYVPNAQWPFTPGWSSFSNDPLIPNSWNDGSVEFDGYPTDNLYLNWYLDSSGTLKFRFVERTYDNRWFQNPTNYLRWDYWKITLYCLDRNTSEASYVEFDFGDAILDGETYYDIYLQAGPNSAGSIYEPTIWVNINDGEILQPLTYFTSRHYVNVALEEITITLNIIDGYHFALTAYIDYLYIRENT